MAKGNDLGVLGQQRREVGEVDVAISGCPSDAKACARALGGHLPGYKI